jgi:hypothetical protein
VLGSSSGFLAPIMDAIAVAIFAPVEEVGSGMLVEGALSMLLESTIMRSEVGVG